MSEVLWGDSTVILAEDWDDADRGFLFTGVGFLLVSFHWRINCTSLEYSPHFIRIYKIGLVQV